MIKEKSNKFEKRILRTISCPQNKYIPRVYNAGQVIGDHQIMHNGLKANGDLECIGLDFDENDMPNGANLQKLEKCLKHGIYYWKK